MSGKKKAESIRELIKKALQAKQNDVVITELENMLQVNCKLEYKCKPISARQFLAGIQHTSDVELFMETLDLLIDHVTCMLEPQEMRPDGWDYIDFKSEKYLKNYAHINGIFNFLSKLGYNEKTEDGIKYLETALCKNETPATLVSLLVMQNDLVHYLKHDHPNPTHVSTLLEGDLRDDIEDPNYSFAKLPAKMELKKPGSPLKKAESTVSSDGGTDDEDEDIIVLDHDCVVCGEPGIATLYCESCKKFSCNDCSLITHRHKLKRNHNPYTLKEYYKKNPFYIPEFECELCGDEKSYWLCHDCTQKHMCKDCEDIQHRHKARRDHKKETIRSYYIQHPIERPAEAIVKSEHIEMTEEQPKEHVVEVPDHDCDVCGESGIAHWRCKECNESKFMCIDCETLKHKNKKMAHNPQTLVDYYTENPVKSEKADVLEEQPMEEDIVVPVAKAEQELIILEHDCDVCGDKDAAGYICYSCKQNLCDGCEKIYHKHIDRRGHDRKTLKQHYTDNPIKVKKHNCDVCGDNATWICQECNQYLCESCKGIVHKRPDRKSHEPQTLRAYYIANPIKDTDAEEPTEGEDQGYFEEDELASAKDISSLLNEVLTEDNIRNDVFLKKQMDTDGNIPLMAIARLPKLTKITKNVRLLRYSLQQSANFIFTGDGKSIHILDNGIEEPKEEETGVQCDICSGSNGSAKYFCSECDKNMCIICEKKYHKHPNRQDHIIAELMENSPNLNDEAEPELPDPKEIYCDVCIEVGKVEVSCGKCDHHFCKVCEKNWHSHPARRGHTVVPIMEFLKAEAEEAKITDPSQIIPKFEEMTEMKSRDERDEIVRDVRDILTNMNDKGSDNIKRADHKMSKKVFEWMSYRLNVEQYLFAQKFGLDMPPKPNKKGIFSPIDYLKNIKDNASKDDLKLHVKIAFEALSASAQSLCPLVADKTDISQMFAFLDLSITIQCTEVDKFSCAENMQLPKPSINTISKLQADLAQEAADKAERREQEERARVIQEQRKSAQEQKSNFESDGRELLAEIMKADKCGFNKQEIDCALMEADQRHKPFTWLQTVWLPSIKEVAELAEKHGNNLGQFSIEETRAVLFHNRNNKNAAVDTLIDNRRKQTLELRKFCPGTNQGNLIEALSDNHGSFNEALEYLTHQNMSNLMRNLSNRESDIPGYDVSLDALKSKSTAPDTKARLAMMGCRFNSIQKGELFVEALDNDQVDAEPIKILRDIQDGKSIGEIVKMCAKECPFCFEPVTRENMQYLPCCECTICKECFKDAYMCAITSKNVSKFSCPGCQQPNLNNNKDEGGKHIDFLNRWVSATLDNDTIYIYEKKIMEWSLMKDESFRWCCHCSEGFVFEYHGVPRIICKCKGESCYNCKEKWEDDHNGKTCAEYQEWKDGQDVRDLAQSLQDSGIDCPQCKFRYELARGGCMHFKCPRCTYEFCSGCTNPFINGSDCKVNSKCAGKGLHCHHPRNCLYDLRDYDVAELQKVLTDAEVEIAESEVGEERPFCIVMEQKDGGEDQPCAKAVLKLNVCETHYKEYLVQLINRNNLDVLSLLNEDKLRHVFTKNDTPVPAVPAGENAVTFLIKAIEEKFPLPKLKSARLL